MADWTKVLGQVLALLLLQGGALASPPYWDATVSAGGTEVPPSANVSAAGTLIPLMEGGTLVPPQDPHSHMNARGEKVMGFDQAATSHHFFLYEDGGAIEVTVKDRSDKKNLSAIREHLPQIVKLFAKGDFSLPGFVHAQPVPGTEDMNRLRDRIAYAYEDVRDGGRVRITTRHARALAAVYQFLRFQIQDHKTGDSLEVTREKGA
jgi:hypothetical protein